MGYRQHRNQSRVSWALPIVIVLGVLGVWLFLIVLPSGAFGSEWSEISTELWIYMPWLVAFGIALYGLVTLGSSTFDAFFTVIVSAALGVISAVIVSTMNTRGHIVDEMVTGSITITDLMLIVFLAWLISGIILGVTRR